MDHPHDAASLSVGGGHMIGMEIDPAPHLVGPQVAQSQVKGGRVVEGGSELLPRHGIEALDEVIHSPLKLVGGRAEQAFDLAIKLQPVFGHMPLPDANLACTHGQLQPLLHFILLGDIPHYGQYAVRSALFIQHGAVDCLPASLLALMGLRLAAQAQFHLGNTAADDLLKQGFQHRGQRRHYVTQVFAVVIFPGEAVDIGQRLVDAAAAKVAVEHAYAERRQLKQLLQLVWIQLTRRWRIWHGFGCLFLHDGS